MSRLSHTRDTQIALSMLSLIAWLGGVVLAPVLHSVGHDLQHTHTPTGIVRVASDDDLQARERALTALVQKLRAPRENTKTGTLQAQPDANHGHDALAHFGVTWTSAKTFVFAPAARRLLQVREQPRRQSTPTVRVRFSVRTSRGPPPEPTSLWIVA